jgi:hypothetical protein
MRSDVSTASLLSDVHSLQLMEYEARLLLPLRQLNNGFLWRLKYPFSLAFNIPLAILPFSNNTFPLLNAAFVIAREKTVERGGD